MISFSRSRIAIRSRRRSRIERSSLGRFRDRDGSVSGPYIVVRLVLLAISDIVVLAVGSLGSLSIGVRLIRY